MTSPVTPDDLIRINEARNQVSLANTEISRIAGKLQEIKSDPDILLVREKDSYWQKFIPRFDGPSSFDSLLDDILNKLTSTLKRGKTTATVSYTYQKREFGTPEYADLIRFEIVDWISEALEKFGITHTKTEKDTRHGVQRSGYDDNWEEGPWHITTTKTVKFTLGLDT